MLENIVISTEDIQNQIEDGQIPQPSVRVAPDGSLHYGMIAAVGKIKVQGHSLGALGGLFRPIISDIGHHPE